MTYKIIASGSKENAVIYENKILVDCGTPFSKIKPFLSDLRLVLLTHAHFDHFNLRTLQKMAFERPALRFGCGEFLKEDLMRGGIKERNIDVYKIWEGVVYSGGNLSVEPIKLYHDVPNFGYRIFINEKKIFHATDTAHLKGITAKGYDLYAIESNYCEDRAQQAIEDAKEKGVFCHANGSIETHLSHRQAYEFFIENKKDDSEFVRLHISQNFG